jgi:hypothetical protein
LPRAESALYPDQESNSDDGIWLHDDRFNPHDDSVLEASDTESDQVCESSENSGQSEEPEDFSDYDEDADKTANASPEAQGRDVRRGRFAALSVMGDMDELEAEEDACSDNLAENNEEQEV